jgi:hypothetical protein
LSGKETQDAAKRRLTLGTQRPIVRKMALFGEIIPVIQGTLSGKENPNAAKQSPPLGTQRPIVKKMALFGEITPVT